MDTIFINNLQVQGILGIHRHEQQNPQLIQISVRVSTDIRNAAVNDDILQSVNYSTLAKDIIEFIDHNHFLTIEALIESLADRILQNQQVSDVWLRVEKPNAVPAAQSVGVEITRSKKA